MEPRCARDMPVLQSSAASRRAFVPLLVLCPVDAALSLRRAQLERGRGASPA